MTRSNRWAFAGFVGLLVLLICLCARTAPVVADSYLVNLFLGLFAQPADSRVAVADIACLQAEGVEMSDVRAVCDQWWVRGPYLECVTDRVAVHKCEVDLASLPDAAVKKFGVCRFQDDDGVWTSRVGFEDLAWTPPPGWTCVQIKARVFRARSQNGIKDELTDALEAKCGWPVDGGSTGCCPHCLVWPEGCPPCRAIGDKYNRDWPGHEAECE